MKSFPTCDKEVNISVLFGSEELNPISSPHTWEFWDTESYDEQWGGGCGEDSKLHHSVTLAEIDIPLGTL
jgi:hypothetical protein